MNGMRSRTLAAITSCIVTSTAPAQVGAPYDRPAGGGLGPISTWNYGPARTGSISYTNIVPSTFPGFGYGLGRGGYWNGYFGTWYPPISWQIDNNWNASTIPDQPRNYARILPAHYLSSAIAAQRVREIADQIEVTTSLTIALPQPGKVWIGDQQLNDSNSTSVLCPAPKLLPGQSHTFRIRAVWSKDGQDYEYTRTMTVAYGEKPSLIVFQGTPAGHGP